jgi:hypothetical protein
MSTSKVIFNIPTSVKKAASKRAEREGLTLTAVLTQAAQAYGEGRIGIEVVETRSLRPAAARRLRTALREVHAGKYTGPFTAKESAAYLRSLKGK